SWGDPTAGLAAGAAGAWGAAASGRRVAGPAGAPPPPSPPPEPPPPGAAPLVEAPPELAARSLPPVVAPSGPTPPARSRLDAGVSARAGSGPAPALMPGAAASIPLAAARAALWSPALRLGGAPHRRPGRARARGTA